VNNDRKVIEGLTERTLRYAKINFIRHLIVMNSM